MNGSSYRWSIELSVASLFVMACGGHTAADSSEERNSNGGTTATATSSAAKGGDSAASTAGKVGGQTGSAASASYSTSGAVSAASSGGTSATVVQGGAKSSIAASSTLAGGTKASIAASGAPTGGAKSSATTSGGTTVFVATTATATITGGNPSRGGSNSTVAPSAGTSSGGTGGSSSAGTTTRVISTPTEVEGIWLVGWSGGMEHYSWIRFSAYDASQGGQLDVLDVAATSAFAPYFRCPGRGSWYLTAQPGTLDVRLPTGCNEGTGTRFVFTSMRPAPSTGLFSKATVEATLQITLSTSATATSVGAYKFPDAQCDAAMTSCQAPF